MKLQNAECVCLFFLCLITFQKWTNGADWKLFSAKIISSDMRFKRIDGPRYFKILELMPYNWDWIECSILSLYYDYRYNCRSSRFSVCINEYIVLDSSTKTARFFSKGFAVFLIFFFSNNKYKKKVTEVEHMQIAKVRKKFQRTISEFSACAKEFFQTILPFSMTTYLTLMRNFDFCVILIFWQNSLIIYV